MDESLGVRKLVAIMAADVAGYSRLMAAQEEATLRALKAHRERIDLAIAAHHGRIVNTAGDSVLAEFASPVAATECAIAIQDGVAKRNTGVPARRVMEFRIGINLGDVIADGQTIYGDGVNVAARLEGLADAGAVLISGSVHEQVHNKMDCLFVYEGRHKVKNIPERIAVYSIVPKESEAAFKRSLQRRRLAIIAGGSAVAAAIGAGALTWFDLWPSRGGRPALVAASDIAAFLDCSECPEMVVVPAGRSQRGSPRSEAGHDPVEGPVATVVLARPFALGRYEVTFAQWDACVTDKGCSYTPIDRGWGRGNRPVIYVNWNDVQEYLRWLSQKTGKAYRLPSEAEWEYAARAHATTAYSWGDKIEPGMANCMQCGDAPSVQTVPVGSFPPNGFGVYDMLGNVWEWVADCWNGSHAGAPVDGSAWVRGECDRRVVRGGSWGLPPSEIRVAKREGDKIELRSGRRGFRVARDLP